MEIDAAIGVRLAFVDGNGAFHVVPMSASKFFEFEDYDEAEWSCHLPWRLLSILDYLPNIIESPRAVELEIDDIRKTVRRRIVLQFLGKDKMTLCWGDLLNHPGRFELILDLEKSPDGVAEVARLEVQDGKINLASHLRIDGDECDSLMP